ncbi:MAG TPA: T9SS type A sorting domain-containing protein [Chitinophagales bacterium]|nr:T9SS type A sorting domain-containing protein [Chitinophagales bacterium]
MKQVYTAFILSILYIAATAQATSFHTQYGISMTGDTVPMSQYYGKKVMVVNCASFCAYTPQYEPLQQLYTDYAQYGFEIIGFPSNDFANQGGRDSDIVATCEEYGVTFPIMGTVKVSASQHGSAVEPVFQWLEKLSLNGVSNASVDWNFNKFLIDEAGHWVRHYGSNTDPLDPAITAWIVDTASVVSGINEQVADIIEMRSANPGNNIAFAFSNAAPQNLTIGLYNTQGQLVKNLYTGIAVKGQSVNQNVSDISTGVYLLRISAAGLQRTIKYLVAR